MHVDPEGVMHPDSGDPVTIDGLTHIAGCEVCKLVRPWLHVRYDPPIRVVLEGRLPPEAEFKAMHYYSIEPMRRGPLMQSARELREAGYTTEPRTFRRSFRCWLGLHNWHEQATSVYDLCVRCGARERAF